MRVCLYSCISYPAGKAHLFCATSVCPLCLVCLYYIIPHLINGMIFEKKKRFFELKNVFFCFSIRLLSETFLILGEIQRDIIVNAYRSLCKVPFFLVRF